MQIPRTCQCLLMSATTSEDVQRLQQLVLHNPTVIDCTDNGSEANDMAGSNAAGTSSQIQHFSIQCDRSAPTARHHSSDVSAFLSCEVLLVKELAAFVVGWFGAPHSKSREENKLECICHKQAMQLWVYSISDD